MKTLKNAKGITLIALVVTIIVLMILSGIVVAALMGDNGLITSANEAKENNRAGAVQDEVALALSENKITEEINKTKGQTGGLKTKADVVADLVAKGYLKEEESNKLLGENGEEEQDTITIGSITIDFSKLVVGAGSGSGSGSGSEVETPKGPNGKPLVNQTTVAEITSDKIVGEDKFGNQVVIPAGFKLAQGENGSGETVKEGIVIDDGVGNQYVWIPVSNINHDGSNKIKVNSADEEGVEITLGRYTFDTSSPGNPPLTDGTYQYASTYATPVALGITPTTTASSKYYQELTTYRQSNGLADTTGTNTTARGVSANGSYNGIQGFIDSVEENHGYYIARYEASYRANGKAGSKPSTSSNETLALISAPSARTEGDLWNFITQGDAANACYDLYTTVNSDLMNSYAWDTAIVYIQAMGNTNYANAYDGNGTLRNTGATGDEKCKIYDMAGNEFEWTTESSTSVNSSFAYPCVLRGGLFSTSYSFTGNRNNSLASNINRNNSFRSALYL